MNTSAPRQQVISPAGFAHRTSQGRWICPRHLALLNRKLVALAAGRIKRLIISMPPRHGKSLLTSQYYPAWYLGTFPDRRVILTSYEADFAASWGRKVRDVITESGQDYFGIRLRADSSAADRWDLADHQGGMTTAGVGGPITGKGADLLICDDPIKNAEEANSPTIRQRHKDWWRSTAYTRLEPGAAAVVMCCMTGDTSVLMATGVEKPLRDIRPGDRVATYDNGKVSISRVLNWINKGPDLVYEIRMKSGIIVKANARHPFLVEEDGETKWRRTDTLKTGSVILKVTGENGRASRAPKKGATNRPDARACATRIIARLGGKPGIGRPLRTPSRIGNGDCAIATGLMTSITTASSPSRAGFAPSVNSRQVPRTPIRFKTEGFASIIATTAKRSEGFSATTAISLSATERPQEPSSPPLSTYGITRDTVAEVVESGVEDVFDVEIQRTENFIANGLVSHNTRWNEDDLPGWLIAESEGDGEKWEVLNLPALAGENDPLGREPGAALWPERYPVDRLEVIRKSIGSYWFASLYQGSPIPAGGGLFRREWLAHVVDAAPAGRVSRIRYWDLASVLGGGDFTSGLKMARTSDGLFYIEDIVRGQWGPHDRDKIIQQTAQLDGRDVPIRIEQEPGSSGVSLIAAMVRMLAGFVVHPDRVTGDKATRAAPLAAQCEAGNVKIVKGPHVKDFIEEAAFFPFGKHDDMIDSASGAFNALASAVSQGPAIVGGKRDAAKLVIR
jgi:predicted phage terminase large subunit-like protein